MNDNARFIVGALVGAVISGVAVWFYQDKRLSKQFMAEIEDYKKHYEETHSNGEGKENVEDVENVEANVLKEDETSDDNDGPTKKDMTKYSSLTRTYRATNNKENETKNEEKGGEKEMNLSERIIKNKPYYISEDDFYSGEIRPGWVQYECFYDYIDDYIYECNSGNPLDGAQTAVGWDIMDDLKAKGRVICPVYVRNDELREEYSIVYGSEGNLDPRALK